MRLLGNRLVDIHSQHQNMLLQQESFQMDVLDIIGGNREMLADHQISATDQALVIDLVML